MSDVLVSTMRPRGPVIALIARRAYTIVNRARIAPTSFAVEITSEPEYADAVNADALPFMVGEADTEAFGKPLTDVLVRGAAHASKPVTTLETAVEVGAARKAVRVIGDREVVLRADGGLGYTAPQPFETFPVTWDHAYGGRDMHTERAFAAEKAARSAFEGRGELDLGPIVCSYMRNPSGRGYFFDLDRERIHGTKAPNLEDPTDPVTADRLLTARTTDWIDRPVAASYGPIDFVTFPRVQFLFPPAFDTPTRRVHELATGALLVEELARRIELDQSMTNPRLFNCAPSGLAVARLTGSERVRMWNLHLAHPFLEFDLPDDPPEMTVVLPGAGKRALAPELQTVLLEPDADRVTLTWAGMLDVAMVYPADDLKEVQRITTWKQRAMS